MDDPAVDGVGEERGEGRAWGVRVSRKAHAEDAARFHQAEEAERPVPDLAAVEFEHFVPDNAATIAG